MQYSQLGSSELNVSRICLGSMTWGFQNNQHDADEQLNYAVSQGVNFVDTAEMYAVPPSAETYGKTEEIIGNWLLRHQEKREQLIIASKIAGPGLPWVRNGGPITPEAIYHAVDNSLTRLNTDYIDVYQLHWPNRQSPHFAQHRPNTLRFTDVDTEAERDSMLGILQALSECIKAGKIRHWGLSDDTTWGINTYLQLAQQHNLPRPVSIQNEFSLLHAKDWPYLIENCWHEDIAYLPWSPLATGMLTGKYLNGARPEGSRWTFQQRQGIFRETQAAHNATAEYVKLASKLNFPPAQLALAWCNQVQGVTSTIIGATTMTQLKENIHAFDITLPDDAMTDINDIFARYPAPF